MYLPPCFSLPRVSPALIALIVLFLSGCGLLSGPGSSPTTPATKQLESLSSSELEELKIESVELLFTRSSLTAIEFEQYLVDQGVIFFECGKVSRNKMIPQEQQFIPLSKDEQAEVDEQTRTILEILRRGSLNLDEPGTNAHLADPGQFTLGIKLASNRNISVKTSFDSISEPGTGATKAMRNLARTLRKLAANRPSGNSPCGRPTFYGLNPR